jgi:hypothetical protein
VLLKENGDMSKKTLKKGNNKIGEYVYIEGEHDSFGFVFSHNKSCLRIHHTFAVRPEEVEQQIESQGFFGVLEHINILIKNIPHFIETLIFYNNTKPPSYVEIHYKNLQCTLGCFEGGVKLDCFNIIEKDNKNNCIWFAINILSEFTEYLKEYYDEIVKKDQ